MLLWEDIKTNSFKVQQIEEKQNVLRVKAVFISLKKTQLFKIENKK